MLMKDRPHVVFTDEDFADLYPADGRPAFLLGQSALVSVLQFAENLSDRATADAVRTRIDWKYIALAAGRPIAIGTVEGACRHLINRLGITGVRWGLHGAKAVLQLRTLIDKRRARRLPALPHRTRGPAPLSCPAEHLSQESPPGPAGGKPLPSGPGAVKVPG
ncbi:transposase [Streptomyces sp. NPDC001107]